MGDPPTPRTQKDLCVELKDPIGAWKTNAYPENPDLPQDTEAWRKLFFLSLFDCFFNHPKFIFLLTVWDKTKFLVELNQFLGGWFV